MPNLYSCPTCAAVIVPQESGGACPKCRTPLPQSEIDTVMPQDLPGMDDATRLAPGSGAASSKSSSRPASHRDGRDSRPSSSTGWLSSSGAIDHGRFEPGTLLGGRYRIVERLGRGGMGEVFRADDLKLGQPVALKFLPPDVDKDPARLTQLHTEVRMARQVSHPNVCRVYDIDEVDGTTFLSMEYVDGEDLGTLLKRVGRFPEERGLEIARQICAGLAAAHERDVIHRDLKPANVMLDGTGKVRITDFGLAGASGEAIRAGTPAYMAPEQLSGHEVTARSDIYALGLVLYEIFTGQRALEASNLAELIHKREQSGIPPATAIVKSLDPKIERVIAKCLKPEVDERPVSALAVAAALAGWRSARGRSRRRRNAITRDGGGCGKSRRPFASRDDGCCRVDCPLAPGGRVVVSARDPPQPSAAAEAARGLAGSGAGGARVARVRPRRRGRHRIGTGPFARLRAVHRGDVHCARSVEPPSHRAARDVLPLVSHESSPARSVGNRVPDRPGEPAA